MKINKILLSTVTTLALLLNGCGGSTETSGSDVVAGNHVALISGDLDNPDNLTVIPVANLYKPAGWYGKTKVTLDANGKIYNHDTAGVFGELKQSEARKDKHDIPGYGDATFQIVFPQTKWGDDNGDYFSNYQAYSTEGMERKTWLFQLKAKGTSDFPITIALDGVFDVTYKEDDNGKVEYKESKNINQSIRNELHLVDVDNNDEYTVSELKTANLKMDGLKTRTFRWVRGTVDQSDYEALAKIVLSTASTKTLNDEDAPGDFLSKTEAPKTAGRSNVPPQF